MIKDEIFGLTDGLFVDSQWTEMIGIRENNIPINNVIISHVHTEATPGCPAS